MKNPVMRSTALLISFALVHISFGPEAWAQLTPKVNISAPVNGGASTAAGAAARLSNGVTSAMPTVTAISANPTAMSAPSAIPSLPVSAVGASVIPTAARTSVSAEPVAAAISARSAAATPASSSEGKAVASMVPAAAPEGTSNETAIQSGPRTATVGRRVAARFAELKNFFGRKSAPTDAPAAAAVSATTRDVPSASSTKVDANLAPSDKDASKVSSSGGDNAPPAPTAGLDAKSSKTEGPQGPAKKARPYILTVGILMASMLIMQVGLEAQGASMAQLTEEAFGDFSILAVVSIFSQLGSIVGQSLSSVVIGKLGKVRTYFIGHTLRAVSIGAMVYLLGAGLMPLTLMYVFYAVNGIVTGITLTADGTLRKIMIGSKGGAQEKFQLWWQFLAEIIGVYAPMYFGALVATAGASVVTAIFPALILTALFFVFATRNMPKEMSQSGPAGGLRAAMKGIAPLLRESAANLLPAIKNGVRSMISSPRALLKSAADWIKSSSLYQGAKDIMTTRIRRYAFLGATMFGVQNVLLYRLWAPGYAKLTAGAAGMSASAGNIVGFFSMGGLFLAVILTFLPMLIAGIMRLFRGAKPKQVLLGAERAADEAKRRRSVIRWAAMGIPALIGLAAFMIPVTTLSAFVALPAWFTANAAGAYLAGMQIQHLGMILFGFFQVAASIKLNALFMDSLPDPNEYDSKPGDSDEKKRADAAKKKEAEVKVQNALSAQGSMMTALTIVAMLAMKPAFSNIPAANPFASAFWYLGALAVAIAMILVGLYRAPAIEHADSPTPRS